MIGQKARHFLLYSAKMVGFPRLLLFFVSITCDFYLILSYCGCF
ncbi:hypothetical protein HSIEG1_3056 [Enterococcus sp. HSIEG1]|nr:hypothetical protein HSIEG1_3056 [Enterococcus sp. HSIEG1]